MPVVLRSVAVAVLLGAGPSALAQTAISGACTGDRLSRTFWCTNATGGFTIQDLANMLIWKGVDYVQTDTKSQIVTQKYKFEAIVATGWYSRGAVFQVRASCGPSCTATVSPTRVNIRLGHVPSVTVTYRNRDVGARTHVPTITLYEEGAAPQPITRKSHAYRCDASWRRVRPGCVIPDYEPVVYTMAVLPEISKNIANGQAKPKHYGKIGSGAPLHYNRTVTNANRAVACPRSRPRPQGTSCDEYPFATTTEGGAVSCPDNCSTADVPTKEQGSQAGLWTTFLRRNRMLPFRAASQGSAAFAGDALYVYTPYAHD